jgi:hypothetical protein
MAERNREAEGDRHVSKQVTGDLPEGWVRYEVEPIEPGGRHSADELLVARGNFAGVLLTRRVLERPAGSRLRKRTMKAAIRGAFALMNRREYDAMFDSIYADDCELTWEGLFLDAGDAGVQRGMAEIRAYFGSLEDAYSAVIYRPLEIVDPGGFALAGCVDTVAVGRSSGIETRLQQGIVWEFESGRLNRQHIFREFSSALEKLGEVVERPSY